MTDFDLQTFREKRDTSVGHWPCTRDELLAAYVARERNFGRAYLAGANLVRANLAGANLAGAYLAGANLVGAVIDWTQPELIIEMLITANGNDKHLNFIGMIALARRMEWCWNNFPYQQVNPKSFAWAKRVLAAYVTEDDNAPPALRRAWRRLKGVEPVIETSDDAGDIPF